MEEWTQAVSHGAITPVADDIITVTVHMTYFRGNVTAIRTSGLGTRCRSPAALRS
jgi:hypothetical protein